MRDPFGVGEKHTHTHTLNFMSYRFLEQTIMHFLDEDQLVYYLQLGRNLLWPDGQFIRKGEPVTAREKEHMRIRVERLLTVCFPGN